MNRLLDIGFQVAGEWLPDNDTVRMSFQRLAGQHNILYAFVCNGEVKYVGVSSQTLRQRMAGYRSPGPKSTTNIRNNRNIRGQLDQGVAVEVYALPDSGLMHIGPFHLNLAAGLEASIITSLRPEWNIVGNRLMKEQIRDGEPELVELEPAVSSDGSTPGTLSEAQDDGAVPLGAFEFTLQRSYWKDGFFNGGVAAKDLLGAGGEHIEIFFGDEATPINGTINRSSPGNRTPRVHGGRELKWRFQTLPELTPMLVEVFAPTSIRIRSKDGVG
ncbi:GIY-YIG nuclease family protein [Paraburkholderia antibiotica]|uniref:GIY-YIG nuclease family protein n=1 Tax=Paraburkholderia antibiotica TaxID=2728839 RepID=UPI00197DB30B|nr:GIY-YIG nuclease family protein [Paraburkholderia antibiotica]